MESLNCKWVAMAFEMTGGLAVADHAKYAEYREAIAPLMEGLGARFRYDFEVARTLKTEANHEINRVFVIHFPDRASKERFFADPRYVEIHARLFDKAVKGTAIIAEYAT
jgi:uncharacterized protein (DUF1330 family)